MDTKKPINLENRNVFISEYLDAYMAMGDVDFAVMISGPWGCGKTHFIKQYLNRRKRRLADPNQNRCWYVSLHGVASCAEIDLRLYEAAHNILGGDKVKLVGHLIRGLVEAGIEIGYRVDADSIGKIFDAGKNVYKKLMKSYGGKEKPDLIVFDDFERSQLDKVVLWGYIGDLLQAQVPIVILGAENEMDINLNGEEEDKKGRAKDEGVKAYHRIREKVIGKTFYLQDELMDLFRLLVGDGIYKNAQAWLKGKYVDIVNDLRKGRGDNWQCNYRALKHTFRQLDYLFGGLKRHKNVWGNESFMQSFTKVFVVVGYQVQIGELTEEDFEIVSLHDDVKHNRLVKFLNEHGYSLMYDELEQPSLLLPVKELKDIFFGYKSDRNRIGDKIAAMPMLNPKKPDDWYLLWRWFQMEDEEAKNIYNRVKKGISEYKYVKAGEIVHIFSIFCGLASRQYISDTISDLKENFKSYIAKIDKDGKLDIDDLWQFRADSGWGGCGYWRIDNCENQPSYDFYKHICEIAKQREDLKKKKENDQLFYSFSNGPEDLQRELMAGAPDRRPLLQDVCADKFFSEFLKLNNYGKVQIRYAFNYRFIQYRNPVVFEYEKKFVVELERLMSRWLHENKESKFATPLFRVITEISETLTRAVEGHDKHASVSNSGI